jgi:hypothetical protein
VIHEGTKSASSGEIRQNATLQFALELQHISPLDATVAKANIHLAPVAGGVADAQQDRPVERLRQRQRLVAPLPPVDRVVGVLLQVRGRRVGETIRHASTLGASHAGGVTENQQRRRAYRAAPLGLAFSVPIGLITFAYGFVSTYMLNDQIDRADHLRFLVLVTAGALLASTLTAVLLGRDRPWDRAVADALLWCCGPTLVMASIVIVAM